MILGNSCVAKTNIIQRLTIKNYIDWIGSNIGISYSLKMILKGVKNKILHRRDNPGQEVYHSVIKNYYKNANIIILVYDIASRIF